MFIVTTKFTSNIMSEDSECGWYLELIFVSVIEYTSCHITWFLSNKPTGLGNHTKKTFFDLLQPCLIVSFSALFQMTSPKQHTVKISLAI